MKALMDTSPLKIMDLAKATSIFLHGVAKNQAIIVCPLSARIMWWLNRISPAFTGIIVRFAAEDFRKKARFEN